MKKTFLSLVVAFAIALSFIFVGPYNVSGQAVIDSSSHIQELVRNDPETFTLNENGVPILKDAYTVTLKDEFFATIDNSPKFLDKSKLLPSNIPEKNAKVVPQLQHEYTMAIGKKIFEKVNQYNGTAGSSLSPLKMQGGHVDEVYSHALRGFQVQGVEDISIFVNDPDVEVVEEVKVPVPTLQYSPYGPRRIGITQIPLASGIRPDGVENSPNVDVAVIDYSVLRTHPDLNIAGTGTQCFVPSGKQCYPPQDPHGTNSAGNIAARDNLAGTVGSAPGARIWSLANCWGVRPSSDYGCTSIIGAVDWVTANAATIEVLNISEGIGCGDLCTSSTTQSQSNTAINNAVNTGVTVVVSAGNDRVNADNKSYCNASLAICVSAMTDIDGKCGGLAPPFGPIDDPPATQRDDARAYFSNYGSVVDIMAPGWAFTGGASLTPSSITTQSLIDSNNKINPFIGASVHGTYGSQGGTSEAAPWVAGAAASLKALHPSWTPAQIKADLQANDIPQEAPCNTSTGLGGLANNPNSGSSEDILNLAAID